MEPILSVKNVKKSFRTSEKEVCAVNNISFNIEQGEILGLVGGSGCGKTTLAKMIIGLCEPDAGTVCYAGREMRGGRSRRKAFCKDIQMIFQDPVASLNPYLTVGQSITDRIKGRDAAFVDHLLETVGLDAGYKSRYPYELSGGQLQRVNIARALAFEPKLLLCDEIVSALDVSVQAQIANVLLRLQRELGLSVLFISHDLFMVRHISDKIAIMYSGVIVEYGRTQEVFDAPFHPYTKMLFRSFRQPEHSSALIGEGPQGGCIYCGKCPHETEKCRSAQPELRRLPDGHYAACFLPCDQVPVS